MHSLNMGTISIFLMVMDTRSVTYAAEVLETSVPSVSRAINKMREEFNNPLFIRTKNGLEPTSLAFTIASDLAQALQHVEQAIKVSKPETQKLNDRRLLRLSLSPVLELYVTSTLQKSGSCFEQFELSCETHDGDLWKDINQLRSRRIDLSLTPQMHSDSSIVNVPLFDIAPQVICRAGHPRIKPGFTMEQLQQEEYLSYTLWPSLIEGNILLGGSKPPIYSSNSMLNLLVMTTTSDYILLCAEQFATGFAEFTNVQILPLPNIKPTATIYAHYHKSRANDVNIATMINNLKQETLSL